MVRRYLFMPPTEKGGGENFDHKILGNFAEGCEWCFRKGDFSGTLDLHKFKKQISSFSS